MPNVKGTAINGRIQYVLRYHGETKLGDILGSLKDQEQAKRLRHGALRGSWYPFELFIDLMETIDRVLGAGDGAMLRKMAGQTAEDDLSTVYKIFFKVLKPAFIVGKAQQLWEQYYDSGSFETIGTGPGFIEMEIKDFSTPHWAHCESILGWSERSISLTGVKNVQAEHTSCRGRGAAKCLMKITWDE